ncbi:MAG: HupE/UreJ family protein [Burkholderiales bacterium]|nr:HupE/UreJ family protein [Burkholderiales bacterium]
MRSDHRIRRCFVGAGIVLLASPAACAHELASRSGAFLAPAVHLVLGVDHVLALLALGILIGQTHGMGRLDSVFSFGLTFFIGIYAMQLIPDTALAPSMEALGSAACALLVGLVVASSLRLPSWAPYLAGGILGLVQGMVSGHAMSEGRALLLSMLGAVLAAIALLVLGAVVASRSSLLRYGAAATRMFGALVAAFGFVMLIAGTIGG